MGFLGRISVIVKSLVNTTTTRLERVAAEEELREARAKREAAEDLRRTSNERPAAAVPPKHGMTASLASDYRLLGLKPDADLDAVEDAWRKLATRADPKRFPAGSDEEKKAAAILTSINQAYERIREALNPTEGRFGQLEL